jgi:anti-sigma B factor antagonist
MTAENRNGATLRIEGEMNIYRAAELKQMLLEPLKDTSTLEVDLSGVAEIDTVGLQLLMLARTTARAAGGELRLTRHSDAVMDVFELLNLGPLFDDPLVMAPRASANPPRR